MAVKYSEALRNARLNQLQTHIGASAVLRMYTGTPPANCAAASTGTLLAEMTLPSTWLAAASAGVAAQSGTWQDATANASGTPGYFRIFESTGTTCHIQGVCGVDLVGDPTDAIVSGSPVVITGYEITEGNA